MHTSLTLTFPDLYFQTSFIINDMGEVILRYRRLISMFAPTPHDVLSQYIEVYGADALFPVAGNAPGSAGLRGIRGDTLSGSHTGIGHTRRRSDSPFL